jgi:translation initiation factor IF-3
MFCTKIMDLGDYTMVKERGTRNNKEQEQGTRKQGTKIVRGLDTDNSDLRMGPTLKFFQTVSVCTEICHG